MIGILIFTITALILGTLLVLTDKYYPRPYANAACAQELIRCWVADGHVVDVLAYEDYDGMPSTWEENAVFYVKPDWRLRSYYYADFFQNTRKKNSIKPNQ